MTRPPSTAALRVPSGMDRGARQALMRPVIEAGVTHAGLIAGLFERESYGDLSDYLGAVTHVWGASVADAIVAEARAMGERYTDQLALDPLRARHEAAQTQGPVGFLLTIPEPDFLTAIEAGIARIEDPFVAGGITSRLNAVCRQRGVPYRTDGIGRLTRFVWTGDAVINEQVIEPALSALQDPRFAKGPAVEFSQGQMELRHGTPPARKQAVAEACNAVESAMKVLLDERGVSRPPKEGADDLYGALLAAGVVPLEARELVLSASRFGNRKGRHGAGPLAHDVSADEAEAVVGAAATALTFLAGRLP